eukprot:TRINITY_DN9388_c0_g1_i1.p1 TRINITY_DN9388_c0_g1~~TRINITY_DN9388_c0_g1_i1.p1  ORF type:complete len:1071 (-),score=218.29 TRINITY_DN9388_c0_g1_i1:229-3441(-)
MERLSFLILLSPKSIQSAGIRRGLDNTSPFGVPSKSQVPWTRKESMELSASPYAMALSRPLIDTSPEVVLTSFFFSTSRIVCVGKSSLKPRRLLLCNCSCRKCLSWIPHATPEPVPVSRRKSSTGTDRRSHVPTFQQSIQILQDYWASMGCAIMQCSNTEVGAGTMNPATFLRVLGPEPWSVAYVEPSVRPDDSRYGDNPNRLQRHTQFQVILKPDPGNSQDLFLGSLSALGIDVKAHDIRFVEDNWESPVLGAWGLGWEVWMDGMEITQFTYFQQAGSIDLMPVSVEITYGIERILMFLQGVDHFKNIQYAPGITYGELFLENEKEMGAYNLEFASTERLQKHFELFDEEARWLLSKGLPIPAYDHVLKVSHVFNILDARGFIGVTERARFFGRMRSLTRQCAKLWVKSRKSLGYPLGTYEESKAPCHHLKTLDDAMRKVITPRAFVLEVGTEELPSQDVMTAVEQLKIIVTSFLDKEKLNHGDMFVYGTPRRLVVYVEDLVHKQDEVEIELRGPPSEKAFDPQGNPTKAVQGFCRKNMISFTDLYRGNEGKTEYVFARKKVSARHTIQILSEALPSIISGINFQKTMRWNSKTSFSRPIRWILSMHGDTIIPFTFAGVLSGQVSHGLRLSSEPFIEVGCAESYKMNMAHAGIVLNMEVMRKHQRYLPILDLETGDLLPAFIAVANGPVDEQAVREGNESVLRARYEDAKFFYKMDIKKSLIDFRSQLNGILFQEKLGTMLDKSRRVEDIIPRLTTELGLEENSTTIAQSAAKIAMSDLATSMVTEFTSLAGIMGRYYALREGYTQEIAEAIFERVLPRFSGDQLPKTEAGIILATADRLDSLVGLCAVGCQPSATSDPFGLRRISYGLVQILVENHKPINLDRAIRIAACVQPVGIPPTLEKDVHAFISRRLEQYLVDKGANVEVVRSILAERSAVPSLASESVKQMELLRESDTFRKVVEAYSRPTKIIRRQNVDARSQVNEILFQMDEEWALWNAFQEVQSQIYPGIEINKFFGLSVQLIAPLENYFNKVFVMTDNEELQRNRLSLLQKIADLPRGILNLSYLPGF